MKIGVFGGTFNPIHNSHIYVTHLAAMQLDLDRLALVPTYSPPHKSSDSLVGAEHRLAMCRLATQEMPYVHVSEYEIQQKGKSYTWKTLRHIAEKYPGAELYLIMGSDMFMTVQDWRRPEELYRLATLCVMSREATEELTALDMQKMRLEQQGATCRRLDLEAKPLSSTQIRNMIRNNEDVSKLVHPAVLAYIRKHRLYTR